MPSATQISSPSAADGRLSGGAVRVAGGESTSKETSTAALASFRQSSLPTQRRARRHQQSFPLSTLPCSAGFPARQAPNVVPAFVGTAFRGGPFATTKGFSEICSGQVTALAVPNSGSNFGASAPEVKVNGGNVMSTLQLPSKIFPIILRVTCSLLLWTLGASAVDLRIPSVQPKEHRVTITFPVDRAKVEHLQRWVNAGHDPWSRDSQLGRRRSPSPGLAIFRLRTCLVLPRA